MGWCRGGCGYRAGNFNDYTRSFCDPGIFEWARMDTGRLNRVGGRDEECDEYESPTRAAFSWIALWTLAWGRAGMCTHMFTYICTYRAELVPSQTGNRVTKLFSLRC
jgi:hypothetical protein